MVKTNFSGHKIWGTQKTLGWHFPRGYGPGYHYIFVNLRMVTVSSTFWLLYQQTIQVSTRSPEARGPGIGRRTPGKISLGGTGFTTCLRSHQQLLLTLSEQNKHRPRTTSVCWSPRRSAKLTMKQTASADILSKESVLSFLSSNFSSNVKFSCNVKDKSTSSRNSCFLRDPTTFSSAV